MYAAMLAPVLLLVGFVPLLFGAHWLVEGASSLAARLNVPRLVIGLTIVAFGTSAPELVVNLVASVEGRPALVLSNVIGSNVLNILLILGVAALFRDLAVQSSTTWSEIPLALLSALVVLVLANDGVLEGRSFSEVSRIDGLVLLGFFLVFMAYTVNLLLRGGAEEDPPLKLYSIGRSFLMIIGGLLLLMLGADLIVDSAVTVATRLGVSERLIGLTIVSAGTSLPELVTSIVAARKGNSDLAIGNVVGSNLFNAFFILGASAVVAPVPLVPGANLDLLVNLGASSLLFLFVFTGSGRRIDRREGLAFLVLYAIYLAVLIGVR